MIIFDLDGTLAYCEHRRHFVERHIACDHWHKIPNHPVDMCDDCKKKNKVWKPNWSAFYDACDKDEPIWPVINVINNLMLKDEDISIWSGRCESKRKKTISWLRDYLEVDAWFYRDCLKMRPIGDNTPDDKLKERWLDEYINSMWPDLEKDKADGKEYRRKNPIDFVFDSDPKSIEMYRRRGIFVFDCNQQ